MNSAIAVSTDTGIAASGGTSSWRSSRRSKPIPIGSQPTAYTALPSNSVGASQLTSNNLHQFNNNSNNSIAASNKPAITTATHHTSRPSSASRNSDEENMSSSTSSWSFAKQRGSINKGNVGSAAAAPLTNGLYNNASNTNTSPNQRYSTISQQRKSSNGQVNPLQSNSLLNNQSTYGNNTNSLLQKPSTTSRLASGGASTLSANPYAPKPLLGTAGTFSNTSSMPIGNAVKGSNQPLPAAHHKHVDFNALQHQTPPSTFPSLNSRPYARANDGPLLPALQGTQLSTTNARQPARSRFAAGGASILAAETNNTAVPAYGRRAF